MPLKILAIDDSKTIRLAVKITFAAEDAEVVSVSKGSEAVPRAKQMGASVVLVDHKLAAREPTGMDVVRQLKSDPGTSGIPVILFVPSRGAPSEAEIGACGADGSIAKPFDTQELIDKVASVMGKPVARPAAVAAAAAPRPAAPAPAPAPTPAAASPKLGALPGLRPPGAPAPAPAPAPPAAAPAAARPPSGPKTAPAPAPAPAPAVARPPSGPRPGAAPVAPTGPIPIARPIPFTSAASPTPGILKRLQEAGGGAAAGLDPQAVRALLQLTHEVVEQVVWEVVPELAEELIKQKASQR